jgi:signal transduction histidine kinase
MFIDFQSTWPFQATAVFIGVLLFFTWKQPNRPGKRYFFLMICLWLAWALAVVLELATRSNDIRFMATLIQIFCVALFSPFQLFFSLEYAGWRQWLTPGRMALLCMPAFLIAILSLTNPIHHLFWSEQRFGADVIEVRSIFSWGVIAYNYLLWFVNIVVLITCMLRAPTFSAPIVLMLIGQSIPMAAFWAARPELTSLSPLQLAMLASNISALIYFLGFYNFRLLRVLPVAREMALEHMAYGLIVLDAEERIIDLNSAARALPGLPQDLVVGRASAQALGTWWDRISPLSGSEPASQEIRVGTGSSQRVFDVHSLPLFHASGWHIGQVFVLNEITSAWHTRQHLAQQQWALATLQEREQLAQELHDGLSQNLAFLNVQAQAVQVYLKTGQAESAQSCLDRLVEVSRQMQGDTRELIGNLMVVSQPADGLVVALQRALSGFEKQTGLGTVLEIDKEANAVCSPDVMDPTVVLQLLRITQEALANVRKHARHPNQIIVRLSVAGEQMQVSVTDNGAGFDTTLVQAGHDRHFGLHIMQQRAARIGAQLSIYSQIGQGTRVEVCVPVGALRSTV